MTENPAAFQTIAQDLERIRRVSSGLDVFGSEMHNFSLNPPLPKPVLERFEAQHKIRLPADYRQFLLTVGNGGAGPAYGVFRLGEMDDAFGHKPWQEQDGLLGVLSEPFPYLESWNELTGMPAGEALDEDEYDRQFEAFDRTYYVPLNGALPICHRGCALRVWLVVSGLEVGHVWYDDRADYNGLYPYNLLGQERATFFQWYRSWLDEILEKVAI